ncbi:RNA-directed DNA polymerase from mobile element jockey [Plakobranchus ocellatus]|uniref:RNA-directed DNA polymerase from mobile element jockey n=1 Tax=Plakobranchus ocellatus TaxID=259542 RepID=A0AAV4BXF3_9GAST|nr:RNA-directed DNA polymerase from mobile element jockey [Plakobranchus ocellatus]
MRRLRKALERRPILSNRTFEVEFTVSELDIAIRKGKAPGLHGQSACLDESQSGFQRHRTTVDQLVRFIKSVINAWQAKSHTVTVFVDLEKAYDRVWLTGLTVRLQENGITGRMYGWLKALLTERFIHTQIKGTLSRTRPLAGSFPHGSALSCSLFLIFMNNIGNAVRTPNKLSYADDIILWQQDTDIDKATETINRDVASLKRFCERWKMRINMGKTAYTTFSLSNPLLKKDLEIRIGNDSTVVSQAPQRGNGQQRARKSNNSTEAGGDKLGRHAPVPEIDPYQLHPTDARICQPGAELSWLNVCG